MDFLQIARRYFMPPEWTDAQGSAVSLRDTGVNVPVLTQIAATGIYLPLFDIGDFIVFSHQFPHSLQELPIVEVHPHIHWVTETSSALLVRWELTYQWINTDPILGVIAAGGTVDTFDGTPIAMAMQLSEWLPVIKPNMKVSSMFMGHIRRVTNGGPDYAGNVFLASFDLHFKQDTLGSLQELIKT